ncbi:MAG: YhdT family protein [Plesiomonas sp.]|uniref:YhdT family protein n=1 Tax=Plesiomonas sp. TaxID=2486279 RepID=UPI003F411F6B
MHDHRFKQAHREARWALWLTIAYLVCWSLLAYLPNNQLGITGLPHWFEMACLLLPLVFILLCGLMVKHIYRDISLESTDEE